MRVSNFLPDFMCGVEKTEEMCLLPSLIMDRRLVEVRRLICFSMAASLERTTGAMFTRSSFLA